MSLENHVIVITGASDGIGAELARQLASQKPKLVLAARRIKVVESVVAQCIAAGAEAIAVRCDVSVEGDEKAAARTGDDREGQDRHVAQADRAGSGRPDGARGAERLNARPGERIEPTRTAASTDRSSAPSYRSPSACR